MKIVPYVSKVAAQFGNSHEPDPRYASVSGDLVIPTEVERSAFPNPATNPDQSSAQRFRRTRSTRTSLS
jgi:hypothetical protein